MGIALYGVIVHFATQTLWNLVQVTALSFSFLVLLPVGMGAATVVLAPTRLKTTWWYALFAPWAPSLLLGLAVAIIAWELAICVLMALPVFLLMASAGGFAAMFYFRSRIQNAPDRPGMDGDTTGRTSLMAVAAVLLLPHLGPPVEGLVEQTTIVRTVESRIVIHSSAPAVWNQFVGVPAIQPHEAPFAWFPLLGLPRPVTAMLDAQELPTVRTASYSNGMKVIEPVTRWEPPYRYGFNVLVDRETLPNPLWRAVESEHFSAQDVGFTVEPIDEDTVSLTLSTTYQLKTPLNPYAAAWIDILLRDFQTYILQVIKVRTEAASL
jgi:hypothetical protein